MNLWKYLINDIKEVCRENPWITRAAISLLCAVLVIGIFSKTPIFVTNNSEKQGANTEQASASTNNAETQGSSEMKSNLDHEQITAINNYSQEEKELNATLESSTWYTSSGTKLMFKDNTFQIEDKTPVVYLISAVKVGEENMSTYTDNTTVTTVSQITTFAIQKQDGTSSLCELETLVQDSYTTRIFTCDDIASGSKFTATSTASSLSFDIDENLSKQIDYKSDELVKLLQDWTNTNVPAASIARWDKQISIDYDSNVAEFKVTFNDPQTITVKVRYFISSGNFSINGNE